MASKKLQYRDIADPNLLDPLIKGFEQLNLQLIEAEKNLAKIATENAKIANTTPLKGYDNIEKVESAIRKTKKATEDLDKVEKDRLRLQERLKNLEDDRAKANAQLRVEISERNRQLKEEAKLASESLGQYQKLSVRLGRLRKEYKETALQYGRNSAAARALRKEVGELSDTLEELDRDVKQQFREIGRYENGLNKLRGTFTKLGAVGAVVQGFSALRDAFLANQEGADAVAKAVGRITITLRVFVQRIIQGADILGNSFKRIGLNIQEFILNIRIGLASIPRLLGGTGENVDQLRQKLDTLNQEYRAISKEGLSDFVDSFKGIGKEIDETIDKNDKLIDSTTKFRKIAISLREELTKLTKEQATLQQQSDDNTLSLEQQEKAALDLLAINEKIAERNVEIARNEVQIARLRVQTNKGSLDDREKLTEAIIALSEAESEAETARLDTLTRIREMERDNLELDLDQLIDLADRRKTVNESIAKDESLTLERRKQALQDALEDIDKSLRLAAEKLQTKGGLFNIDDLINETDTQKLNERIKAIGLDEIRQNRLREILQERIQATEDLRTAQNDLNKAEEETRDIEKDIIAQEEALKAIREGEISANEILEGLEERRLELAIESLKVRKNLAEEGSLERLRLEQELNEKLLEQAQNQAKEEVKVEKDKQKGIKNEAQEGFEALSDLSESFFEQRVDEIDKEIDAAQEREDQLRELAAQGNQDAQNSLAAEQKRQADLELQRAQQLKKQKLAELQLSAIELFSANVSAGQSGGRALASTGVQIKALTEFIKNLPGFYEGSERIADDMDPIFSGRDGYLFRGDGEERILKGVHNAMIPKTMSNFELASLAQNGGNPDIKEFWRLGQKIDGVRHEIAKKPVYQGMDFDEKNKAVTWTIQERNRITRKHKKISGVIG